MMSFIIKNTITLICYISNIPVTESIYESHAVALALRPSVACLNNCGNSETRVLQ